MLQASAESRAHVFIQFSLFAAYLRLQQFDVQHLKMPVFIRGSPEAGQELLLCLCR